MGDTDDFLCARCAASGRTCCQDTQVFLTGGDVARIDSVGEAGFWERRRPAGENYAPDPAHDPLWGRIFADDGSRRVLRHGGAGDCHFLTDAGCRLPAAVRPLVCRLYPFDYNHDTIKGVHGHLCPEPGNAPLLLAMLGMNRNEAEGWRKQLYSEIGDEFPA